MKRHFKTLATVMVCMAMALYVSCKKDDDESNGGNVATVTTDDVTGITRNSAVCGGEVKSENGWAITERGVCWSTSQNPTPSDNCTVDGDGVGEFISEITGLESATKYYVRAYATDSAGISYGEQKDFITLVTGDGIITGHEYVNLGLPSGLLWATCNVGADSIEDYGDYFAWGEAETKSYYTWSTYKWCNGDYDNLTKYNTDSDYGTVDNKTVLEPEDDAAHVNWGGSWRMPTKDELTELENKCEWTRIIQNGVNGYHVMDPNGNSIFLPAAGYYYSGILDGVESRGYYWSGSLGTDFPSSAYYLLFVRDLYDNNRCCGRTVRPVSAPQE